MIEKRKKQRLEDKTLFFKKKGCSYGFDDKKLEFPFMTMQNDKYALFMTQIMKNLEVRFFKQGYVIVEE